MKKLTVNHLAFSNLRARKKQYTLMVIGIVLAMIFSSGILFFISCMNTSLTELSYSGYGCQDVIMASITDRDALNGAVKNGIFKDYGGAYILGFAYTEDKETKGFSIAKYDEKGLEISRQSIIEGRMPEKAGEIAIESDALIRLKLDTKPGEKISIKFKVQNGDGYLEKVIDKTYILTGILKDKRRNIQWYNSNEDTGDLPAAIVSGEELIEAGGKERFCAYVSFAKKGLQDTYWGDMMDYQEKHPFYNDSKVYYTEGNMSWNLGGGDIESKGYLAGVLAAALAVASCVGIINAFNTNLQDRKKQIGLLRAVGATRRQIIILFGREAFIIALLAAPLSVVVSYFITKGIIRFMGEEMVFAPKLWILFAGAALSLIVVMTAALVPLFAASRISPMQSIRNIDIMRKMKNKKIHTKKEYKVPGLIAKRDIAFTKGKSVAVCIMLIISFLLSSMGISFLSFSFETTPQSYFGNDYEIYRNMWGCSTEFSNSAAADGYGISNAILNEVLLNPYVDSLDITNTANETMILKKQYRIFDAINAGCNGFLLKGKNACPVLTKDTYETFIEEKAKEQYKDYYTQEDLDYIYKPERETKEKFGIGDNYYNGQILTYSEKRIKELSDYIIDGKIDIDKINSGEEIIIVLPKRVAVTYSANNEHWDDEGDMTFVSFNSMFNVKPDGTIEHLEKEQTILEIVDNDIKAGDEVDISLIFDKYPGSEGIDFSKDIYSSEAKQYRKTVRIGAVVTQEGGLGYTGTVLTTNSGYASIGCPDTVSSVGINLKCECTEEIDNAMATFLDAITSGDNMEYNSEFAAKQDSEKQARTIIVGFASIVILFFAICTSLINNSMSTKIREDKRQIGTLRAVGASAGELTKAYLMRLIRLFAIGFAAGNIAYLAVHFGLYYYLLLTQRIDENGYMHYLVWPSLIFTFLMFAVCAFNLWIQVRKQMKYSIVDNIREL